MRSAKSLKAKGRYLQNVVKGKITGLFPYLKKKDIRCARDSEPGPDIKLLSLTSRKLFPYDVESKNREEYRTCLLYTSPSPRDRTRSRMPSSA